MENRDRRVSLAEMMKGILTLSGGKNRGASLIGRDGRSVSWCWDSEGTLSMRDKMVFSLDGK